MSNPNNQTSEYNFPPNHGGQNNGGQFAQQQGWGQQHGSSARAPKKKSSVGKVLLIILLVLVLLVVAAEFAARWYMKDQIVQGLEKQASADNLQLKEDPSVSFGLSPVLMGMATQNLQQLDMTVPSTLNISHEDGDESKPVVTGNPEVKFHGKHIKIQNQGQDVIIGDLTMNTAVPSEYLLAQAVKGTQEQHSGGGGGFLQQAITLTGVKPVPDEQVLEMEISHGLATLKMKPVVENGELKMQAEGGEIFGLSLPQQFVDSIQDSLNSSTSESGPGGLKFENATVTDEGLAVEMHGTNVDMNELSQSVEETPGTDGAAGGSGSSGSSDSSTSGALNEEQQREGDAIGSSTSGMAA
ncbi:DUF2993 domain-containing protein [Corynebacterium sp. ED61]|uniref:LmeA family phospholipid-binding protein n=1 Tax=Corynebacterium sp. ED61 TaxID=2211360 RepID=UPI00188366C6|nr:DUF2993 domain-containing protein [Corynebacterium sp. ED61]